MTSRFNLEPLASPGYRRYLLAATLAALALWIYEPALEWIVLRRTGETAAVGLIQTVLIIPVAVASLPSGVLADRIGSRRMVAISLMGIGAAVAGVGVLGLVDSITFEFAIVLTLVLGIFDGLYPVAAQLIVTRLVEPRFLGSAIGLSMLSNGIGRLIGAPLGGLVLQELGPAQAFLPAAGVLLLSGLIVLTIPVVERHEPGAASLGAGDVRDSMRWLWRQPTALAITTLGAIAAAFAYGYGALPPTITRDLLHADSGELGLLSGAAGVGAIVSALTLETLGRRVGRGRLVVGSVAAAGIAIGAIGLTGVLELSLGLSLLIALFTSTFAGTAALLLQTMAPPRMRARILALYGFVFYSILPVATVTAGALADRFGVQAVLLGMGAMTAIGAAAIVLAHREVLGTDVGRDGGLLIHGQPMSVGPRGNLVPRPPRQHDPSSPDHGVLSSEP
ncbi:MAG TPA: MFS transporter [Candidatus Saccharimonadales bacterium]|nr:MFS transporter [Candidatus Saccharimonadales bacterium]